MFEAKARAEQIFRQMDRERGLAPSDERSPAWCVGLVALGIIAFVAYVLTVTAVFGT